MNDNRGNYILIGGAAIFVLCILALLGMHHAFNLKALGDFVSAVFTWTLAVAVALFLMYRYAKATPNKPSKADKMMATVPAAVHCPVCHSNKVGRISGGQKAKSAFLWGIFAIGRISKVFVCLNCGYRF